MVNHWKDTCVDVESCQDSSQGMKDTRLLLVPRLLDAVPALDVWIIIWCILFSKEIFDLPRTAGELANLKATICLLSSTMEFAKMPEGEMEH